jgi:CRISPR/Cas system-associated protein Cas5 (RAMP superfamily)
MKKILLTLSLFILFFSTATISYANSPYVLPYPSTMPGGISYKVHLVWEKLMQFWCFGDFGQFDYNLKQSDKYLVEAKTLFEYNQYLLGYQALQKSDAYFEKVNPSLISAQKQGKDISDKKKLLSQAAEKHIEVLSKMKNETPADFTWIPEKSSPTTLNIAQTIDQAVVIRKQSL